MFYHYKPLQVVSLNPVWVGEGHNKVSTELSPLRGEQPQVPQPVTAREALQPSDHLCDPHLDSFQEFDVLPVLKTHRWMQHFRWDLTRAEHRGRIPFLTMLAKLLWIQTRIPLPFWVLSTHWQIMSSTNTPKFFPSGLLSVHSQLSPYLFLVCLDPDVGLALHFLELYEVCRGPSLKPVRILLDGIPLFQQVGCTTQLNVFGKLDEIVVITSAHVANEEV